MVNEVNADRKVGMVYIGLSRWNNWNDELFTLITSRYANMYGVYIADNNSSVVTVHNSIKNLVR